MGNLSGKEKKIKKGSRDAIKKKRRRVFRSQRKNDQRCWKGERSAPRTPWNDATIMPQSDGTAASLVHAMWPLPSALVRLKIQTSAEGQKSVSVVICKGLEGNFYAQRGDQRMHIRERLSSEQLKLKETYEFIGHVTATFRLLLLVLVLLVVCSCLFSGRVVLSPNIIGIFNFSHFYPLHASGFLAFTSLYKKK